MTDPRHRVGIDGERRAAEWLESLGWQILARRWRSPVGELDLVCLDRSRRLVGVEVRARRTARAASPLESVTPRHRSRLRAALVAFALSNRVPHTGVRVDLIAVTPGDTAWCLTRHPAIDAW